MNDLPFQQPKLSFEEAYQVLRFGTFNRVFGYFPWGSNHTYLASVRFKQHTVLSIYKPKKGERPLWDFVAGALCYREQAAYLISEALGWRIVPPTILKEGEFGEGSVQWYVPHSPEDNYFSFDDVEMDQLQRIALFDHIINNADRKGGHILLDEDRKMWAIDHGVSFHHHHKLRTVIWDFAGEKIPVTLMLGMQQLETNLTQNNLEIPLEGLLTHTEISALLRRIHYLLDTGVYPLAGPGRNHPWPPV
jgi:uncharacterized repeat protein (TIGR03843 family)